VSSTRGKTEHPDKLLHTKMGIDVHISAFYYSAHHKVVEYKELRKAFHKDHGVRIPK
jgi:hypothetical protein